MGAPTVLAAGGVVWRRSGATVQVAVVHRPRYDDWSLPKGKLHDGEAALEAAVREVGEELGASVAVSRRLPNARYDIGAATKKVTYWAMQWRSGDFVPNDEVDAVEWLAVPAATERVTHDTDRVVLRDFAAVPLPDAVIVLVRHAKAGKRTAWRGDDALRPLDPNGVRQADRLASLLAAFVPQRIVSADRVRCVSTVAPLAAATGLEVVRDATFNDEAYEQSPTDTEHALLALARPGTVNVVCSQGLTIPALIDRFGPGVRSAETRKGAWWVLSLVDGDVVSVDRYGAP